MSWKQKMFLVTWAVFLTLLLLGGVHVYTRLQLGNIAYQQLLIEKNQQNIQRQQQIDERNRLMGAPRGEPQGEPR